MGWVRIADLGRSDGLTLTSTTQRLSPAGVARSRLLPPGTLVMSIAATVGLPIVTAIPACIHDGFVALQNLKGVDQAFLFYVLKSLEPELRAAGQTGSQSNVNTGIVKGLTVALPPKQEQLRIAEVLFDVDREAAALRRLIEKKDDVRRAMMQQLLSGAIRLPGFSGSWRTVSLRHAVRYVKTTPLPRAKLYEGSGVACLHYGDVHGSSSVRLDASRTPVPRAPSHLTEGAGRLLVGDLVFVDASEDRSGVGKSVEITSLPPEGMVAGLHTIAARFARNVLADGFKAYLQFTPGFRGSLLRLAAGTKVLATTRDHISSVELPLPEPAEQVAIAAVLQHCDREIDVLHARLSKTEAMKHGMLQELLSGRTRLPARELATA